MEIDEIIEILKDWKDFRNSSPETIDKLAFGSWLLSNSSIRENSNLSPIIRTGKHLTDEYSANYQFLASYFLNRMNKFIKIYTKDIFQELGLYSSEDFSFLALVHQMEKPNKKQLCDTNLTEMTTGLDIIRRLIKLGYINEVPDESDKRSKRMVMTPKGLEAVNKIYLKLNQMSNDVLGDLNAEERSVIIKLLTRLNTFHTKIVMPEKH